MHLIAPAVRDAVDIPLVHLIEVVARAAKADGLRRLGLLGTAYAMSSSLYPDACGPLGIDVVVPDPATQGQVQSVIYEDLTRGAVTDRAATTTRDAAEQLLKEGADAIVLGCTELGLVMHGGDVDVPVLDTTEMHVGALVDAALA
jgi:aspartate racemase